MTFVALADSDVDDVAEFLTSQAWPFHAGGTPTAAEVRGRLAAGYYAGPDVETFWLVADDRRCGLLRLFDLEDGAPLFDLRIAEADRGHGLGTAAVRWLTAHLFTTRPAVDRIEATTRYDNHAMRRVLAHCGYVKESHWRRSWPVSGDEAGGPVDGVGYAILRSDWVTGAVTPVEWTA